MKVKEVYFGFAKELLDKGIATTEDSYGADNLYDLTIQYTNDVEFYVNLAKSCSGKVLDIGCGTGRMLRPLLEAGVDSVGLDYSPHMLSLAREKLNAYGFHPLLVQGDMRDFRLDSSFDLIMIPYYSMIYMLSDEDRVKVFSSVYQHLAAEGTFAFDFDASVNKIEESFPWVGLQGIHPLTGDVLISVVQQKGLSADLRIINQINYCYGDNSRITVKHSVESSCRADQIKQLLESVGFTSIRMYANYDLMPYQQGDECVVIVKK